jgi:acyl carrier protein
MTAVPPSPAAADLVGGHPDVVNSITFSTAREPVRRVTAVVLAPGASVVDLRDHLWETLDPADRPDALVALPDLPRDAAGEVDTAIIEAEVLDRPGTWTFRPLATPTEQAVADVWREVLGRSRIGGDDNFLDLGGDSMTAALLLDLTIERLGVDLTLGEMLSTVSLASLAELIDSRRGQ